MIVLCFYAAVILGACIGIAALADYFERRDRKGDE